MNLRKVQTDHSGSSDEPPKNRLSYKMMVLIAIGLVALLYLATFIPDIRAEDGKEGWAVDLQQRFDAR